MRSEAFINNHYVVVDVEAMSVAQTAQILSIGAVVVNLEKGILPYHFYMPIEGQIDDRFSRPSDATHAFWQKLLDENSLAAKVLCDPRAMPLREVLLAFKDWLTSFSSFEYRFIVGKGTRYDGGLIANAFEVEKIDFPFHYRNESCLRALVDQASIIGCPETNEEVPGIFHHALFDAHYEAKRFLHLMNQNLQLGIDELVQNTLSEDVMSETWAIEEKALLESYE